MYVKNIALRGGGTEPAKRGYHLDCTRKEKAWVDVMFKL